MISNGEELTTCMKVIEWDFIDKKNHKAKRRTKKAVGKTKKEKK